MCYKIAIFFLSMVLFTLVLSNISYANDRESRHDAISQHPENPGAVEKFFRNNTRDLDKNGEIDDFEIMIGDGIADQLKQGSRLSRGMGFKAEIQSVPDAEVLYTKDYPILMFGYKATQVESDLYSKVLNQELSGKTLTCRTVCINPDYLVAACGALSVNLRGHKNIHDFMHERVRGRGNTQLTECPSDP